MNGFETQRRIHAMYPDLPVVLMSGDLGSGEAAELIASGAVAVLPKPFDLSQLNRQVARLVDRHRMALDARRVA
jgi:DNA-binding NtrC family response regulator